MARIDLVALQQRLAQQQPEPATPVPAEPPSWEHKASAPPSASHNAPARRKQAQPQRRRPAARADDQRATLPLKTTNARAERAEERARANAPRADRLNEQVEALSAKVVRAKKQADAAVGRAERAEAGRDAKHARAEALHTTIDELNAGQTLMTEK